MVRLLDLHDQKFEQNNYILHMIMKDDKNSVFHLQELTLSIYCCLNIGFYLQKVIQEY